MVKTVLIVDDSEFVLNSLEKELNKELDIRILKATNFKEALNYILEEEIIHIAVIDLNLSGAKNAKVINYARRKDIPTVILAEKFNDKLKDIILKKDILDYVIKNNLDCIGKIVDIVRRTLKNYDTNVMVVEDSPVQLSVAVKKLEKMKFNVTAAVNGKEAFDFVQKGDKKYSLILTDYNMPVMDGIELTFKLREIYKKDRLGIIVLSSSDQPDIATIFIKIGANDFINKPYSDVEFTTRINSNLELLDIFEQSRKKDQHLFRSEKMASMGEMIANIAHQWRQPLSAISSLVSGLKVQKNIGIEVDDKELEEAFDTIFERTQFLTQTIDDFRNFTKEDKDIEQINTKDIVKRVISILHANIIHLHIELDINIEDDCTFSGLPGEISQVILNIINNAKDILKHKEQKIKKITINAYKKDDNIIIKIQDNAGGIPEDILHKIFDPYFTTKHQSQGTGIGLYMSKNIIEQHHNGILTASNDDEGAIFTITLPITQAY